MKAKWLLKKIGTAIWENRSNIEYVAGNIMIVAGTCMAISKAEDAVEVKHEMERQIRNIELTDEADGWESGNERARACMKMAMTTATGYISVYGFPVVIEVGGLILTGISKATDRKEIASKSVALASIAAQFYNYRQNVRDDLGIEKDEEYLLDKKNQITTTVDENGNTIIEDKGLRIPDHSFLFDETNPNYEKEGFMNRDFLEDHERWINDRLWAEGYLTENDIRRDVKAPISEAAAEGDWGITAVDEHGNRNYISFGIGRSTERAQAFRDGTEKSFLVVLDNMEPCITKKLYRLNKYHKDVQIQIQ